MIYTPRVYQEYSEKWMYENPCSGLFLDMGLGKTVVSLTVADRLMYQDLEIDKVLVIAPKKVVENVWSNEAAKWDHLNHLKVSKILGTPAQRIAALKQKADIYTINCENVVWLISFLGGAWPFQWVIVDESTKFKSSKAARFKALRQVIPRSKRVTILTGTPRPKSMIDLWSQIYLLDKGERLGKTLTSYRDAYFNPGKRNGHVIYDYKLKGKTEAEAEANKQEIYNKINDICVSMKSEDWLDLPPLIEQNVEVTLPDEVYKQYLEFEKKLVLSLAEEEISAVNAAVLSNKLLQFANGAVYTTKPDYYEVHNAKIEALETDLEALNGDPYLIFYQYQHDLDRIRKHLKHFEPRLLKKPEDMTDWNKGKIPFALMHAASGGHGLNLQDGGNYLGWFGPTWNLEHYQQAPKRIHRSGQKSEKVFMRKYLTKGTMDYDAMLSLEQKADGQEALMQAVKARITKYRKLAK